MPHPPFDRSRIRFRPLAERSSKVGIEEIAVDPDGPVPPPEAAAAGLDEAARAIVRARKRGAPVVLCHGAHLIRNGLGPLLARLVREGWVTHVATNGAGSIHDWEFAYQGRSTEDVRAYVAVGEFGIWDETGRMLGLALHAGSYDGIGYGGAVGRLVAEESLRIPPRGEVRRAVERALAGEIPLEKGAAAADLLAVLESGDVPEGVLPVPHPWKAWSVQCACHETGSHFTVHPGIGQDIVYSHPMVRGGAVGRAAMTDFLLLAAAIERLDGGVYLSIGSSVMSPMVFEKSLSMARNVLRQAGRKLDDFEIVVNDLVQCDWDWCRGEPPVGNPAYYVRFLKTFSRMGGRFRYIGMDNRAFLLNLRARLGAESARATGGGPVNPSPSS